MRLLFFRLRFREVIAKVRLAAFRRFCQPSAFGANPLLARVCGFAPNAESWQNHSKIGKIGTFAITSKIILIRESMHQQIETLRKHFDAELGAVATVADLEALKVKYLGKKVSDPDPDEGAKRCSLRRAPSRG